MGKESESLDNLVGDETRGKRRTIGIPSKQSTKEKKKKIKLILYKSNFAQISKN